MLLAKSKESKNSGKNLYKSWALLLLSPFLLHANSAFAQSNTLSNPTSILSIFLSLLLVVAIVFMLAYLMRRFNVTHSGSGELKVVASMVAGTRERVMVLEVGNEQHLIGVTANNINHLAKLEQPIAPSKPAGEDFKHKLTQLMAGKLNPNLQGNKD